MSINEIVEFENKTLRMLSRAAHLQLNKLYYKSFSFPVYVLFPKFEILRSLSNNMVDND